MQTMVNLNIESLNKTLKLILYGISREEEKPSDRKRSSGPAKSDHFKLLTRSSFWLERPVPSLTSAGGLTTRKGSETDGSKAHARRSFLRRCDVQEGFPTQIHSARKDNIYIICM